MLRETNWNKFFRLIDKLVHILDDFPYPLKRFQVFPSLRAISFYGGDKESHVHKLNISFSS